MACNTKISVIIPAYNEEATLKVCLEALARQHSKPHEIIVVDNNSTDATATIARSFDGVTVINEATQGLIPARNRGFREATGTILARIDADTIVASDWTQQIAEIFDSQPNVQAATGSGYFYDAPHKRTFRAVRNVVAVWTNRLVLGHHMLWGSNMALRRSAWNVIEGSACNERNIMEDLDLASHITDAFGRQATHFCPDMQADISLRRATAALKNNYYYLAMWPHTLKKHHYKIYFITWPVIALLLFLNPFVRIQVRLFDIEKQRMVWTLAQWRSSAAFDNPNP